MQPKATTLISIKPNQQVDIFFCNFLQGGTQTAVRTEYYKVIHSSKQFQSKQLKHYAGIGTKKQTSKTPETNCKVLLDLKYYNWIN